MDGFVSSARHDQDLPFYRREREFSKTIQATSASFVKLFNQAETAEEMGLEDVCGAGYRKALEFLVKDFAISKTVAPDQKEAIKKAPLGACIDDFVKHPSIKAVTKRAAWLGNDETHYYRKWEGKDLSDLKNLIHLAVHWIEMDHATEAMVSEMPEKA